MNAWKRRFLRFLLETIIFRFHVSFPGGGGNHDLQFMICSSSWPQRPPSPRPHLASPTYSPVDRCPPPLPPLYHRALAGWVVAWNIPMEKSQWLCSFLLIHSLKTKMTLENHHGLIQDTSSKSCCFHCHVSCPGV